MKGTSCLIRIRDRVDCWRLGKSVSFIGTQMESWKLLTDRLTKTFSTVNINCTYLIRVILLDLTELPALLYSPFNRFIRLLPNT